MGKRKGKRKGKEGNVGKRKVEELCVQVKKLILKNTMKLSSSSLLLTVYKTSSIILIDSVIFYFSEKRLNLIN